MSKPRTPCKYCGGEKPPGRGRKACDSCLDKMKPIFEQQRYRQRQERARGERIAAGSPRTMALLAPEGQKWCKRCQQYLSLSEFGTRGKKLAGYCRPCTSAYNHEVLLKRTFGITVEEYERLLAVQDGRCAICERRPRKRRLAVDHDHDTGEVRGLLCTRCNHKLLGAAYESAPVLRRAARYLEVPPAETGQPVPADEGDLLEMQLGEEIDRASAAADNDGAQLGVVWHKRRGKGSPADWFVTMDGATFAFMLRECLGIEAPPGPVKPGEAVAREEVWAHLLAPEDPRHAHDTDAAGNCRNTSCGYYADGQGGPTGVLAP